MAQYQQLDSILKSAEDLISNGQIESALLVLHDGIVSKKKGQMGTQEKVMMRLIECSVKITSTKLLKDAMSMYRNICQNSTPQSLMTVMDYLSKLAENRVEEALKNCSGTIEITDLEAENSPDSILLQTMQGNAETDGISSSLAFLWETYKISLDLLKHNGKMMTVYRDTAFHAFEFCKKYGRKNECKRLCDALKLHLQGAIRSRKQITYSYQINVDDPEQNADLRKIRIMQMQIAMELNLLQEAFKAAEDMHSLISIAHENNSSPTPKESNDLQTCLRLIFWESGHYLLHALACHLIYNSNLRFRKEIPPEEAVALANMVVLSTLAVPPYNNKEDTQNEQEQELIFRLAGMLSTTGLPSHDFLVSQIKMKNTLSACSPEIRDLFIFMNAAQFLPLTCKDNVTPVLNLIKQDKELNIYEANILQLTTYRTLSYLSKCYKNMLFTRLYRILEFIPTQLIDGLLIDVSLNGDLNIKLDHGKSIVLFEKAAEMRLLYKVKTVSNSFYEVNKIISGSSITANRMETQERLLAQFNLEEEKATRAEKMKQAAEFASVRRQDAENTQKVKKAEVEEQKKVEAISSSQREFEREKNKKILEYETELKQLRLSEINTTITKFKRYGFSTRDLTVKGTPLENATEAQKLELSSDIHRDLIKKLYLKHSSDRTRDLREDYNRFEYLERGKHQLECDKLAAKWTADTESRSQFIDNKLRTRHEFEKSIKDQFPGVIAVKAKIYEKEVANAEVRQAEAEEKWKESMKALYTEKVLALAKKKQMDEEARRLEKERIDEEDRLRLENAAKQAGAISQLQAESKYDRSTPTQSETSSQYGDHYSRFSNSRNTEEPSGAAGWRRNDVQDQSRYEERKGPQGPSGFSRGPETGGPAPRRGGGSRFQNSKRAQEPQGPKKDYTKEAPKVDEEGYTTATGKSTHS